MIPGIDYTGIGVSFLCHDGAGNILLSQRSERCRDEHHCWEAGGGKLEYGEDPREAVLREIREEYGVEGIIDRALPAVSLTREHQGKPTHWITLPFVVRVPREGVKNGEPEFISELGWFSLDALPQPLHTGFAATMSVLGSEVRAVIEGTA